MTYSTLYAVTHDGTPDELIAITNGISATVYIVGVQVDGKIVCHGAPGDPIPASATVYYNGQSAWTWNQIKTAYPAVADVVTPHEWAGEPTAKSLRRDFFKKLPILAVEG